MAAPVAARIRVMPLLVVAALDATLIAIVVWNMVELGFFESRDP